MTDPNHPRDPGADPGVEPALEGSVRGAVQLEPPPSPDERAVPPWVSRAIALAAGWVVLLFAAYWMLGRLRTLLIMILVAFFLSLAMEPAVDRLAKRGWRRGSATALVLGIVLVFSAVFLAAAGSIVVGQAGDLIDRAPRYVRDFERFVNDDLGIEFNADSIVRDLRSGGGGISGDNSEIVSNAAKVALAVGRGLLYFVTVLIFAFYMTADGPRMRRSICSRLPRARQEVVLDTWEIAIDKTGGYLYSRGIQAVISALVTWAFLFALGVPYSLALGLWVGIVSQFIPTVGTYIAMVLPVVVALKESPAKALWVLVFLVLYQQFENYILGPRVTKHSMDVHPALAIGTVFAGGLLLGGVGAILALPATAVIQAVISGYTTEREIIDAPLLQEQERKSRFSRLRARFRRRPGTPEDSDASAERAGDPE
jgi:predicted PurR-regulated permease PerM